MNKYALLTYIYSLCIIIQYNYAQDYGSTILLSILIVVKIYRKNQIYIFIPVITDKARRL